MNSDLLRERLRDLADVPLRFWAVAVGGAVLLFFLGTSPGGPRGPGPWLDLGMDEGVATAFWGVNNLALVLVALAPLVALRWMWTALGLLLPAGAVALVAGAGAPWVVFPALVVVAVVAVWRHPRLAWVPAALAAGFAVSVVLAAGRFLLPYGVTVEFTYDRDATYLAITCGMYVGAVLLAMAAGHLMRHSARRAGEQSALDRQRRETASEAAALGERSRLAHDLHDVVAHHVSLIAVRAETAPYTQPGLGPEARGVLTEIAGDARLALDELRGVLGILSRAEDDGSDRAPQPGLPEVPALVERSRAAGAEVMMRAEVDPADPGVLPGVGYVAYRVVQEALTNARRHAPGRPVTVSLRPGAGALVVSVSNPVDPEAVAGPAGRGLAGMRERVEALGGQLVVEAGDDAFTVRATLPRVAA